MKLTKKILNNLIKEELEEACGIPTEPLPDMIEEPSKKRIVIRILRESDLSNPWAPPSEEADTAVPEKEPTAEGAFEEIADKLNQARKIKAKIDRVIKPGLTGRVRPNQRWAAKIMHALGEYESGGLYDEIYNLYNELAELWQEGQMEWPKDFDLADWRANDRFEKIWIVNSLVDNLHSAMGILKSIRAEDAGRSDKYVGNNWDYLFEILKKYKKIELTVT